MPFARSLAPEKFTDTHSPAHEPSVTTHDPDFPAHRSAPTQQAPFFHHAQRASGNLATQHIIQRPLQSQATPSSDQLTADEHAVPSTTGQSLDPSDAAPLEQHFQTDLSEVRIHTGSEAEASAAQLDALAYTTGRDIYFAAGTYSPATSSGRRLLAHEVAHVVQQAAGKEAGTFAKSAHGAKIAPSDDTLENEADRHAEQFVTGQSTTDLTEEERRKRASSPVIQKAPASIQRQQAQPQSTTNLDATAQSILRGARDSSRDVGARAVEAVWRIIHEYYPNQAPNVNAVTFDTTQAGSGLATRPYPASNPTSGKIFVGADFLTGVQEARSFAHRVLQVGHELEHIDQFKNPHLGPSEQKKDEREFLAFYHEALATEVLHTGRFQHSNRIVVIDQALGYYNCLTLSSDPDKQNAAKTYASYQQQLVARRSAEIADMVSKGYVNVPSGSAPSACQRQR